MRAGTLRHRIDILKKEVIQNPVTGVVSDVWTYRYRGVPAAYRTLTSRERMAANQRQSEVTSEFEIRWGLAIEPTDKIAFNGKLWDIDPPEDDPTLKRMQKIRAVAKSSLQTIEVAD